MVIGADHRHAQRGSEEGLVVVGLGLSVRGHVPQVARGHLLLVALLRSV